MEERRDNSVIQAEFDGLKELINEKFSSVCKELAHGNEIMKAHDETIKTHNGRLTTVERFVEQAKGAGKFASAWWGIAAAVIASVVAFMIQNHF